MVVVVSSRNRFGQFSSKNSTNQFRRSFFKISVLSVILDTVTTSEKQYFFEWLFFLQNRENREVLVNKVPIVSVTSVRLLQINILPSSLTQGVQYLASVKQVHNREIHLHILFLVFPLLLFFSSPFSRALFLSLYKLQTQMYMYVYSTFIFYISEEFDSHLPYQENQLSCFFFKNMDLSSIEIEN